MIHIRNGPGNHDGLPITRRRFLGAMVAGGAAALTVPRLAGTPAGATRDTAGAARGILNEPRPLSQKRAAFLANRPAGSPAGAFDSQQLAPDGALRTSVEGPLVSKGEGYVVVVASRPKTPITVLVVPSTTVVARGQIANGDCSICQINDDMFVATTFNYLGQRVASYIGANEYAFWGTVTQVSGESVSCTAYSNSGVKEWPAWIRIGPNTSLPNGVPTIGSDIYFVGTSNEPGNVYSMWAKVIETLSSW
jgi:hypothetical protein